ncbi:hypothetical protein VB10N_27430 [Vibrio sp. 10N]|nr:hypothetical protein VB10N_27430 [Vibrio sp. 10N]
MSIKMLNLCICDLDHTLHSMRFRKIVTKDLVLIFRSPATSRIIHAVNLFIAGALYVSTR